MPSVWLNGRIVQESEACIPVSDRGFHYGEGSFTTARVYNGQVEYWDRHAARLKRQAEWLGFAARDVPLEGIAALIEANQAERGVWRLKAIQTAQTDLLLLQPYEPPSVPLRLQLAAAGYTAPTARYKTLAYLDRLRYLRDGHSVIQSPEGWLLESPIANLYWKYEGVLYTPSRTLPLLWGITIDRLTEEYESVEGCFRLEDIPRGAEIYLCNCLMGSVPVACIGTGHAHPSGAQE